MWATAFLAYGGKGINHLFAIRGLDRIRGLPYSHPSYPTPRLVHYCWNPVTFKKHRTVGAHLLSGPGVVIFAPEPLPLIRGIRRDTMKTAAIAAALLAVCEVAVGASYKVCHGCFCEPNYPT